MPLQIQTDAWATTLAESYKGTYAVEVVDTFTADVQAFTQREPWHSGRVHYWNGKGKARLVELWTGTETPDDAHNWPDDRLRLVRILASKTGDDERPLWTDWSYLPNNDPEGDAFRPEILAASVIAEISDILELAHQATRSGDPNYMRAALFAIKVGALRTLGAPVGVDVANVGFSIRGDLLGLSGPWELNDMAGVQITLQSDQGLQVVYRPTPAMIARPGARELLKRCIAWMYGVNLGHTLPLSGAETSNEQRDDDVGAERQPEPGDGAGDPAIGEQPRGDWQPPRIPQN